MWYFTPTCACIPNIPVSSPSTSACMRFRSRGISWLKKAHTHLLHITRAKKTLSPELWALCSLPGTQCADSLVYYNYSNNTVYLFYSKFNKYYSSCHVCFNFHLHTKSQTEPLISVLNAFTGKPKQINKEDKHLLLLCFITLRVLIPAWWIIFL